MTVMLIDVFSYVVIDGQKPFAESEEELAIVNDKQALTCFKVSAAVGLPNDFRKLIWKNSPSVLLYV